MTATMSEKAGTTVLPPRDLNTAPVVRKLGQIPAETRFIAWGSAVAAIAMAWLIVGRLLPVHGSGWFIVVAAFCDVVLMGVATAAVDKRNVAVSDRLARWFISSAAVIVFAALFSVLVFVFQRGWPALHHWNFITQDMAGVGPSDPLDRGGVLHAILGSLIELAIAVGITLPLGVGTAVFMNEVGGRFATVVRTVVEAMTALPSIVAGLFIYTVWILEVGAPSSGLAGALAISVMMLPIIARASDVVLRVVPGSLREASLALGASRWSTVWHVVLPTARPGLATALILGIARGVGETSPVLITSGNASFIHLDPTHDVMTSLPLFIYSTVRSGIDVQIQRAFGCAAVLLILVLVLFTVARLLARPASTKPPVWRRAFAGLRSLAALGAAASRTRSRVGHPLPADTHSPQMKDEDGL